MPSFAPNSGPISTSARSVVNLHPACHSTSATNSFHCLLPILSFVPRFWPRIQPRTPIRSLLKSIEPVMSSVANVPAARSQNSSNPFIPLSFTRSQLRSVVLALRAALSPPISAPPLPRVEIVPLRTHSFHFLSKQNGFVWYFSLP